MNFPYSFALVATLAISACATPQDLGEATTVTPATDAELVGPGRRLSPTGSSTGCTFVSVRPAGLPAGAGEDLILKLLPSEIPTRLKVGATVHVAPGNYRVVSPTLNDGLSAFGPGYMSVALYDNVTCAAGSTVRLNPTYVGSSLAIPFANMVFSGGIIGPYEREIAFAEAKWIAIPQDTIAGMCSSAGSLATWTYGSKHSPLGNIACGSSSRVWDFAPRMAKVHFQLDDVDPSFPTQRGTNVENRGPGGAFMLNTHDNRVREVHADVLVYAGSSLRLSAGSSYDRKWLSPDLVVGTRTVITLRRLEVDHLVPSGGVAIPGSFDVTPIGEGRFGASGVPTHTGIDLLPGIYRVETSATDAHGVAYTNTQTITL